jgi:uncharacterized protein
MSESRLSHMRAPRIWGALGIVAIAYFLTSPVELSIYHWLFHAIGLRTSSPNTLGRATYGTLMLVRLLLNSGLWIAVCAMLNQSAEAFPISDRQWFQHTLIGLATGLIVMLVTILGIWGLQSAIVTSSGQTLTGSFGNGIGWLLLDFAGALGEEIYGRAIVLVVAEAFLGWKCAMIVSGVMFSGFHVSNLGATRIWLFRLFLQGVVLAYAVFRTNSVWWSVGYHTGWNWVSAPLFGAVGSGYFDEGHILNFWPHGSIWITGGSVGPEGSVLAFVAVLAALGLLFITTKPMTPRPRSGLM